jgi:predicted house-cleaning noncanonical NTP pyrophosphatase (MazG superfamily)
MKIQLNESKFRNMLTEMVKEVLLLMEATPLEKTANQCKDILQYYIPNFIDSPKALDFIYKQFINTYFHGNSNNIVGKLSPIFLHLVWYFNGLYNQHPIYQDKIYLSKVKEMIRILSIYANNQNVQYQNELNGIKNCIKQCIEQISNGSQINTDELLISDSQKRVINRFLSYYNQLVRQNNQPNNLDDLINKKIQGSGAQYIIIDEIFNKYKSFTGSTNNNSNELPQYEELFTSLETKCNEAKKEINTTTNSATDNNTNTATDNNTVHNTNYELIKIENMDKASLYGEYSGGYTIDENDYVTYEGELCFTNTPYKWEEFTDHGNNTCYLLLDKGWFDNHNIYCTKELSDKSSDNPYDDYGMSMIFIFVTPEGELSNSNTRWNHRADYSTYGKSCDNAFTQEDIQKLISTEDYKEIFNNRLNEKINELNNGKPLENVFQIIKEVNGYTIIRYKDKYNLVYYGEDNVCKIRWYPEYYSLWFTDCNIINNRFIELEVNYNKFNIFDTHNNRFIIDTKNLRGWFDNIIISNNNLFWVVKNHKENYLGVDNNGELQCLFGDINNTDEWFEWIHENYSINGCYFVKFNNKYNIIHLKSDKTYTVMFGDKQDINTWLDYIRYNSVNGICRLIKRNKINLINEKLEFMLQKPIEKWFEIDADEDSDILDMTLKRNYIPVKINNGINVIDVENFRCVFNQFIQCDYIKILGDKILLISVNDKYQFYNKYGNLIGDKNMWFDKYIVRDIGNDRVRRPRKSEYKKLGGRLLATLYSNGEEYNLIQDNTSNSDTEYRIVPNDKMENQPLNEMINRLVRNYRKY